MPANMKEKENKVSEEEESENEKDVEALEEAGSEDDWEPPKDGSRKRSSRGSSRRSYADTADSDDDEEDASGDDGESAPPPKRGRGRARGAGRSGRGRSGGGGSGGRGRGRGRAKAKKDSEEEEEDADNPPAKDEEEDESSSEESEDDDPPPPMYQSGNFVVLKTEYDEGGSYSIWKIDGKSLLQKYVRSESDENIYVSTTIYAGWSKSCIEKYYPATIKPQKQDGRDHYVKFEKAEKASNEKES